MKKGVRKAKDQKTRVKLTSKQPTLHLHHRRPIRVLKRVRRVQVHVLPPQCPEVLVGFAVRRRLLRADQLALHLDDGLASSLHPDVEAVTRQRHHLFFENKSVEAGLGEVIAEDADLLADGREDGFGSRNGAGF